MKQEVWAQGYMTKHSIGSKWTRLFWAHVWYVFITCGHLHLLNLQCLQQKRKCIPWFKIKQRRPGLSMSTISTVWVPCCQGLTAYYSTRYSPSWQIWAVQTLHCAPHYHSTVGSSHQPLPVSDVSVAFQTLCPGEQSQYWESVLSTINNTHAKKLRIQFKNSWKSALSESPTSAMFCPPDVLVIDS